MSEADRGEVSDEETARCTTAEEWLRLYIARNPSATAPLVQMMYMATPLYKRLGQVPIEAIEGMQQALGTRAAARAAEDEQMRNALARREARQRRARELAAMSVDELLALAWPELTRAVIARWEPWDDLHGDRLLVFAAWLLDADVRNGGFEQYFDNHPEGFDDALAGLELLGASEHAAIARAAGEHDARAYPRGVRAAALERRDPVFSELDERYYEVGGRRTRPNLFEQRLDGYLRAHLRELVAPAAT